MGRPSFSPTPEQRAQVAALSKARVAVEEIARRLDLAPKTLRKHFAVELGLVQAETVITREFTRFVATEEQKEVVTILAGGRFSRPEIARKIGVSVEVLQEHFAKQLEDGPVKCRSDAVQAIYHAMRGGNMTAAKLWLIISSQGDDDQPGEQPAAAGLRGKKQQQAIAAKTAEAGTGWEDLVAPGRPN
ncbi:MAG TPA: hypothetical protein VKR31_00765 [Rhizomicrobium sp.]|nr:hypothetical protein [Rhizomicrobium sp.]